jgi:hypothetical protein
VIATNSSQVTVIIQISSEVIFIINTQIINYEKYFYLLKDWLIYVSAAGQSFCIFQQELRFYNTKWLDLINKYLHIQY